MVGHLRRVTRPISNSILRAQWLMSAGREYSARRSAAALRMESQRSEFYRRVWRDAADALGADCRSVGRGILEFRHGTKRTRVYANETEADDPVTVRLTDDKVSVHTLLAGHGLPVPDHLEFTLATMESAARFMDRLDASYVVKAARSTGGGKGVTTGIRNGSDLKKAAVHAAIYARELLIEKQVAGDVYRLLYLDGRLIDTVLRRAPTVVGDDHSTIAELIERENLSRIGQSGTAQTLINIDPDLRRTLALSGHSLRSVLRDGVAIAVKTATNDNASRDNFAANGVLSPKILEASRRAVDILKVHLAGVDVVTADPTGSLRGSGGVILEINARPGYYYHYHRRSPGAAVAIPVLARMLGIGGHDTAPEIHHDRMP